MLFLDKQRYQIAHNSREFKEPRQFHGDFMASAFAEMYRAFEVYRSIPTSSTLKIRHLDQWLERNRTSLGLGDDQDLFNLLNTEALSGH